jgi:hypothetical protein
MVYAMLALASSVGRLAAAQEAIGNGPVLMFWPNQPEHARRSKQLEPGSGTAQV